VLHLLVRTSLPRVPEATADMCANFVTKVRRKCNGPVFRAGVVIGVD
jgi:hypothetical protein